MTAKEAKQLAEESIQSMTITEMVTINSAIKNAASRGDFQIYADKISTHSKAKLELDGYSVKLEQTGMNESSYIISWK